jgi:hypothetical protein
MVEKLREALEQGRPGEGETSEITGYRQAEAIMDICREGEPVDF